MNPRPGTAGATKGKPRGGNSLLRGGQQIWGSLRRTQLVVREPLKSLSPVLSSGEVVAGSAWQSFSRLTKRLLASANRKSGTDARALSRPPSFSN